MRPWLAQELRLTVKPLELLVATARGVPFLGFRVRGTHLLLTGVRKRRFRRAVRACARRFARGALSDAAYAARLLSLFSHVERARTRGLRVALLRQLSADKLPVAE